MAWGIERRGTQDDPQVTSAPSSLSALATSIHRLDPDSGPLSLTSPEVALGETGADHLSVVHRTLKNAADMSVSVRGTTGTS